MLANIASGLKNFSSQDFTVDAKVVIRIAQQDEENVKAGTDTWDSRLPKKKAVKLSLLLLTLLTACSSKFSADDLSKELETVTSWAATAQMVGEAWIHRSVPTVYAKQTLSKAQEKLHKETDTLAHSSTNPRQRDSILQHLQRLESTVSQMSMAIEQKDHTAMTQQLKQLATQEQTLKALAKTAGGQK